MRVRWKDLPIGIAQEVPPDPACSDLCSLGRGLVFDGVEIGRAAQDIVVFELVHREIFRASFEWPIAAGAEKPRNLEQSRDMLLVVPAIELGLEAGIDVGPHHQQSGAACFAHCRLLKCEAPTTWLSSRLGLCRVRSACAGATN